MFAELQAAKSKTLELKLLIYRHSTNARPCAGTLIWNLAPRASLSKRCAATQKGCGAASETWNLDLHPAGSELVRIENCADWTSGLPFESQIPCFLSASISKSLHRSHALIKMYSGQASRLTVLSQRSWHAGQNARRIVGSLHSSV